MQLTSSLYPTILDYSMKNWIFVMKLYASLRKPCCSCAQDLKIFTCFGTCITIKLQNKDERSKITQYFIHYRCLKIYLKKKSKFSYLKNQSSNWRKIDTNVQEHKIMLLKSSRKKNNAGQCFVSFRNVLKKTKHSFQW